MPLLLLFPANNDTGFHSQIIFPITPDENHQLLLFVPKDFLLSKGIIPLDVDDEIMTTTSNVSLSYHALSRQYLVNRDTHQKSFETLSEAREELSQLSDWKVLEKSLVEKGEVYKAALLMRLDQTKLPKAIQVDAIATEKWNLTSQKFEWPLKELLK